MTPTIEEVTATLQTVRNSVIYDVRSAPPITFAINAKELQAFAQHYIEVGEKKQREKDVQVCLSKHANGNYKNDTRDDCAEAIRNNTGE